MLLKKVLLATALCATAVSASAAEWYNAGATMLGAERASVAYADKSSLSCNRGVCKIWQAHIFYPPLQNGANLATTLNEYDCKNTMVRILDATYYSYSTFLRHAPEAATVWEYVAPGTVGETGLKMACGKAQFVEPKLLDIDDKVIKISEEVLAYIFKLPPPAHAKN